MPACGVSPEAMANAMASGSATRPTVIPAMTSFKNLFRLYSRRQITDLGNQRSSSFREMTGHIYTIMPAVAFGFEWRERNESGPVRLHGAAGDPPARLLLLVWCRQKAAGEPPATT